MAVMAVFLVVAVLAVGLLFLRLHTLPERMAHRSHKLQFEIVAVLGLLALFTHMHIFWVIGLLLALIDIPDFGSPLRSMAGSLEKIAGVDAGRRAQTERRSEVSAVSRRRRDAARGRGRRSPKTMPVPGRTHEGADRCLSFFSARCSRSFRTTSSAAMCRESGSARRSPSTRSGSSSGGASWPA